MKYLRFIIAFCVVMLIANTTVYPQTTMAGEESVVGKIRRLRALSNGRAVMQTERAIYLSDDNTLTRWTAIVVLPGKDMPTSYVGGSSDRMYFLFGAQDAEDLKVWTSKGGLEVIRQIPTKLSRLVVSFVDAQRGFYTDEEGIVLTLDGGKTWIPRQALLPDSEWIIQAQWISSNGILITGKDRTHAFYSVNANGVLTKQWSNKLVYYEGFAPSGGDHVWAYSSDMRVRSLRDGTELAATARKERGGHMEVVATSDIAYFAWAEEMEVWRYSGSKLELMANKQGRSPTSLIALSSGVYGVSADYMSLVRLTPDDKKAEPLVITANNSAIRQWDLEDEAAHPNRATKAEMAEMLKLALQFSPAEQVKLTKSITDTKELTNREKILLMTEAYKKALAEQHSQTQPKP